MLAAARRLGLTRATTVRCISRQAVRPGADRVPFSVGMRVASSGPGLGAERTTTLKPGG
jgi:hypothetical protein